MRFVFTLFTFFVFFETTAMMASDLDDLPSASKTISPVAEVDSPPLSRQGSTSSLGSCMDVIEFALKKGLIHPDSQENGGADRLPREKRESNDPEETSEVGSFVESDGDPIDWTYEILKKTTIDAFERNDRISEKIQFIRKLFTERSLREFELVASYVYGFPHHSINEIGCGYILSGFDPDGHMILSCFQLGGALHRYIIPSLIQTPLELYVGFPIKTLVELQCVLDSFAQEGTLENLSQHLPEQMTFLDGTFQMHRFKASDGSDKIRLSADFYDTPAHAL